MRARCVPQCGAQNRRSINTLVVLFSTQAQKSLKKKKPKKQSSEEAEKLKGETKDTHRVRNQAPFLEALHAGGRKTHYPSLSWLSKEKPKTNNKTHLENSPWGQSPEGWLPALGGHLRVWVPWNQTLG